MSQETKERLQKLTREIECDKITVSFSMESPRGGDSGKRSVFCSLSSSQKQTYSWEDTRVVSLVMAKRVVGTVYANAVNTKVISQGVLEAELPGIFQTFDTTIDGLMGGSK